ncbi:MAG: GNAT family N-acetyltransferase [Propionibacteriaceae bacterium]|nr:GNAT family N-acetyltransferase [Propionibacteriaceae bacterium]
MPNHLSLRPLTIDDAPAMARVLSHPSLYEFTGGEPPTLEQLQNQYSFQVLGGPSDGSEQWLNHLVILDGDPIGYVQATIPASGEATEVAWVIGQPWQAQGHASSAMLLFIDDLRARGVTALVAHIHPHHAASQRIAQKLGLQPTDQLVDGEVRWEGTVAPAEFDTDMVGWDFSRLDGRMWADEPPWDFEAMCLEAMGRATRVLDMGTGGGERLIALLQQLPKPWPEVVATEGWAPNVPVAMENLAEWGVQVLAYDPETEEELPAASGGFDLIMNRHEAIDAQELARVLAPGGIFLTQQVDGTELPELREIFGGEPAYPQATLEHQRTLIEAAGLGVVDAEEWAGEMGFESPEALDEYLALVPWDRPAAFDASRLPEGPVTLTAKRFRITAKRG